MELMFPPQVTYQTCWHPYQHLIRDFDLNISQSSVFKVKSGQMG